MYLVILHSSGRIDAEALQSLVERTAMMYRAGAQPPMLAVLGCGDTLPAAATKAAEWRAHRRNAGMEKQDMSNAVKWLVQQRIRFLKQQARDTRVIETTDADDRAWYLDQAEKIEAEIKELEGFEWNIGGEGRGASPRTSPPTGSESFS